MVSVARRPDGGVPAGVHSAEADSVPAGEELSPKLQEALPDTVDLLGIVLGTGLGLDQAMMRVSEEMQYIYPELAERVRHGGDAGARRTGARQDFNQFVRRTGIEDIKSLAAMIIQSEKFGTSLAQALKVYADALRNRRRLRAEAAVGKAGIKMLFPIAVHPPGAVHHHAGAGRIERPARPAGRNRREEIHRLSEGFRYIASIEIHDHASTTTSEKAMLTAATVAGPFWEPVAIAKKPARKSTPVIAEYAAQPA